MNNILIARQGFVYTNGETFGCTIRLGINDNTENWQEVPETEYNEPRDNVKESDND